MLRAVIFDMDGVLIDSEPFYKQRRKNFLKQYGIEFDDASAAGFIGLTFRDILAHYFTWEEQAEATQAFIDYRNAHPPDFKRLLDAEAGELLAWLKEQGLKLAVASSSSIEAIKEVMAISGWGRYFDLLVSGNEFPRSKPDPAIYLATVKRLNISPEEVIVVEDSPHGITAAKNAGLKVIVKEDASFDLDRSKGDYFVTGLNEVTKILVDEDFLKE